MLVIIMIIIIKTITIIKIVTVNIVTQQSSIDSICFCRSLIMIVNIENFENK